MRMQSVLYSRPGVFIVTCKSISNSFAFLVWQFLLFAKSQNNMASWKIVHLQVFGKLDLANPKKEAHKLIFSPAMYVFRANSISFARRRPPPREFASGDVFFYLCNEQFILFKCLLNPLASFGYYLFVYVHVGSYYLMLLLAEGRACLIVCHIID
jgi:hypothetical protein